MISEVCLLYICKPKVQWENHCSKKMSRWINTTSYRNFVAGAWGRQCYLGNKIRNVLWCVLSCSIRVQNFVEFDWIITELCSFMYLLNLLTQLVTSQLLLDQQFIFCTFLQITSELKGIVYYSKPPISSLFHALSHKTINKTIKFYCQCPLRRLKCSLQTRFLNSFLF